MRDSIFAREVTEPETEPPAEGIFHDSKAKAKSKLLGGGLFESDKQSHKVNDAFQLRSKTSIRLGS